MGLRLGSGITESLLSEIFMGRGVSPGPLSLPLVSNSDLRRISNSASLLSAPQPLGLNLCSQPFPQASHPVPVGSSLSHWSGCRPVHRTSITASHDSLLPFKTEPLSLEPKAFTPHPFTVSPHYPRPPLSSRGLSSHLPAATRVLMRLPVLSPTPVGRAYLDTPPVGGPFH